MDKCTAFYIIVTAKASADDFFKNSTILCVIKCIEQRNHTQLKILLRFCKHSINVILQNPSLKEGKK